MEILAIAKLLTGIYNIVITVLLGYFIEKVINIIEG